MPPEHTDMRIVGHGSSTYTKEARHIQKRALRDDTCVVKLGPIIFFCANRDAWMLDPEDHFARCIMRDGEKLPLGITEKGTQFLIEWKADYQIDGEVFTVAERSGSIRSIIGYPTRLIQDQLS
jgi:hypothetical protein